MSTQNKISEEQLKSLQEKVASIQNLNSQIGILEGQKHLLLHRAVTEQEELQKMQGELEQEYGKVSINMQDGTYEEIKEDQE
ncbi:hypothetical protein [Vibrio sp.]|uniref:hypothetical protein n=1 Tax=Vibrio sp. TaxID=678 RepID=UPI00312008E8